MDEEYNDIVNAQQKEAQAEGLRNQESLNKDDPTVINNLDAAARELDRDAADLRQDAENIAAEANQPEEE